MENSPPSVGLIARANEPVGARPAEYRYDLPACYLASYAATIAHFVEGLRDARPFETEPADNLRTLALVEAVYQQAGQESR